VYELGDGTVVGADQLIDTVDPLVLALTPVGADNVPVLALALPVPLLVQNANALTAPRRTAITAVNMAARRVMRRGLVMISSPALSRNRTGSR
jgi:hypothetical protein